MGTRKMLFTGWYGELKDNILSLRFFLMKYLSETF